MARNAKLKLNLQGVNKLLRAHQPMVDRLGRKIASGAKGNYRYVSNEHRWTGRGHVETADAETAANDAKTHELLKSLGRAIE